MTMRDEDNFDPLADPEAFARASVFAVGWSLWSAWFHLDKETCEQWRPVMERAEARRLADGEHQS